eukprot:scaffold85776_cov63-Phaeocystis_antarctica.AAC.1
MAVLASHRITLWFWSAPASVGGPSWSFHARHVTFFTCPFNTRFEPSMVMGNRPAAWSLRPRYESYAPSAAALNFAWVCSFTADDASIEAIGRTGVCARRGRRKPGG